MKIVEQIQQNVARDVLEQATQTESQWREFIITASIQGIYVNDLKVKDIDIISVPHHGSGSMTVLVDAKWNDLQNDPRISFAAATGAIGNKFHRRPSIMETHRGVVSEVMGDEVEITYETPAGPLRQIYSSERFVGGIPNEGDNVEAKVTVTVVEREPNVFEEEFESDIPSFEGRAIKGQARI